MNFEELDIDVNNEKLKYIYQQVPFPIKLLKCTLANAKNTQYLFDGD